MKKINIPKSITLRDTEAITRYLREINRYSLLTVEEEVILSKKVKQGDKHARDKFVCANTRFVVSVAKTFQYTRLPLEDLISEGHFGLIDAVNRFDETKGFKFISFAIWHIRQHIYKFISEQGSSIRLPGNQIIIGMKMKRTVQSLEQRYERLPTYSEIAEFAELTIAQVKDNATNPNLILSIDKISDFDSGLRLVDVIENIDSPKPDHNLYLESKQINLDRLLGVLNDRMATIIQHFFGTNGFTHLTLEEIAKVVGLSKERTRQLKDEALAILRRTANGKSLFLDTL